MAQSFREFLDRLRLAADIVEVVGQHVELRRAGNRYKGLCPFHQEKTPSFTVSPERQSYYCFGCHTGGDAIDFVKRVESLEWRDAVEVLAKRCGLEVPRFQGKDEDEQTRKRREALYAINALAAEFYAEILRHPQRGREAREYLAARAIGDETIRRFGMGLAPDGWSNLQRAGNSKSFSDEAMAAAGLLIHNEEKAKYYDRFRNRIMFPICDASGRPIGFGGRIFGASAPDSNEAKYINSPETAIYKKGQCLYAFHLASEAIKSQGHAIILEGYTDVIALHEHGFVNAVASLGTALTPEQTRLLRRLCKEVIFLYDDDEAGRKAMLRGTEILLAQGLTVRCVGLREGEDPDSFLRNYGKEAFSQRLASAKPFFEHFLGLARGQFDFKTVPGRTAAADMLAPLLRAVSNVIEAEQYIQNLAEALGIAPDIVRAHVFPSAAGQARRAKTAPGMDQAVAETGQTQTPQAELALLRILIDHPDFRSIIGGFDVEWMEDARARLWARRLLERADTSAAGFHNLLEEGRDEAERDFLRRVAMLETEIADPSRTIVQTAKRIEKRWKSRQAALLKQRLGVEGLSEIDSAKGGEVKITDAIHRIHQERYAAIQDFLSAADNEPDEGK